MLRFVYNQINSRNTYHEYISKINMKTHRTNIQAVQAVRDGENIQSRCASAVPASEKESSKAKEPLRGGILGE